jgi:uncharacterized membrane protein
MKKKWVGTWIAAIAVTNTLTLLALAQDKAAPAVGADQEPVEEIETIEEVTPVAVASSADSTGAIGLAKKLIGKFHPMLVHFPIAWVMLLLLVDLATFLLRRPWQTFGYLLGLGVALSVFPVVVTGLLRAATMGASGELLDLIVDHRNLALTASTVLLIAIVLRVARRNHLVGWTRSAYLGLLLVATALIGITGHYGGMVVHGKDFFGLTG